jgi:allantoicase
MSTTAAMSSEVSGGLVNLAEDELGAEVLWATDEFFAAKERMLSRAEPVSRPGTFDAHGQWMDGWESRRRRGGGHDAAIIRLGLRGVIRLIDLDTRYFTGNFPPQASVEATDDPDALKPDAHWTILLPPSALQGNRHNPFPIENRECWRFLRLNIFPDGGIARLRVWGDVRPDWHNIGTHRIDLLAVENGGVGLIANDQHYGQIGNLNRPGRGINMGDGWETRRRREPGHDWAVLRLGRPGTIDEIEVDTAHFRGNFPDRVSLQAALIDNIATEALENASATWPLLLPEQPMRADHQHKFKTELLRLGPVSHVRLNLHPDGGVSRLRLYGSSVHK